MRFLVDEVPLYVQYRHPGHLLERKPDRFDVLNIRRVRSIFFLHILFPPITHLIFRPFGLVPETTLFRGSPSLKDQETDVVPIAANSSICKRRSLCLATGEPRPPRKFSYERGTSVPIAVSTTIFKRRSLCLAT